MTFAFVSLSNKKRYVPEKRHKSSSSLAGILEGVRSERKIDLRGTYPLVI